MYNLGEYNLCVFHHFRFSMKWRLLCLFISAVYYTNDTGTNCDEFSKRLRSTPIAVKCSTKQDEYTMCARIHTSLCCNVHTILSRFSNTFQQNHNKCLHSTHFSLLLLFLWCIVYHRLINWKTRVFDLIKRWTWSELMTLKTYHNFMSFKTFFFSFTCHFFSCSKLMCLNGDQHSR